MTCFDIEHTVVRQAVCRYGMYEYRAFVCKNDIRPGTGDDEDTVDVSEDLEKESYCIWYEDFLNKGQLKAGGGYFESIEQAIIKAETDPCFQKWIVD